MLGLSPLNTFLLATADNEQGAEYAGTELLKICCSVHSRQQTGELLAISRSVYRKVDTGGDLLSIARIVNPVADAEILQLSQHVLNRAHNRFMRANFAKGFDGEKYAIRIFIAGIELCNAVRSCEVHFTEKESATANLYLLEPCGQLDLYQYYNQPIVIFAQTDKYLYQVFSGVVDMPKIDYSERLRNITATHDRSKSVEKMSLDTIHHIGYWSESVFGEEKNYETKNAQLTDRLSTIPVSFDYDAKGQGHLTSWLPKTKEDWHLGGCDIYLENMSLELSSAVSLVNRVEIELHHQYDRLIHREITFSYRYLNFMSDYDYIVRVAAESPAPKLADVVSAANGGGWITGKWATKGAPPPGYYNGILWRAADYHYSYQPTGEKDKDGNNIVNIVQTADSKDSELYALSASWHAIKRWKQAVDEKYSIVVLNQPSISIHGEKKEKVTYGIKHDSNEDKTAKNWGNEKHYKLPMGVLQPNGDYATNVDKVIPNGFADGYQVAVQIAYTRMLESHRQNSINLDCKFLPFISLTDTVHIQTNRFNANVKVAAYSHSWDFRSKRGKTTLTGKFFMNPASNSKEFSPVCQPVNRPVLPSEPYQNKFILKDYAIAYGVEIIEQDPDEDKNEDEDEDKEDKQDGNSWAGVGQSKFRLDKANGYVRKETGYTFKGKRVLRGLAFRVEVPSVEEKSTDTLDVNGVSQTIYVDIPHNEPYAHLTCLKG